MFSSNIDLLLTLNPNGWSKARFVIDYEIFEYDVSHVLNNAYADTLDALLILIRGDNQSSFFYCDEPYGIKIDLKIEENDTVIFSIFDVKKELYRQINDNDLDLIKSFRISLKQLLILFYYQFKKTCVLLEDKDYAVNRSKNFPSQIFFQFEKLVKKMYKI